MRPAFPPFLSFAFCSVHHGLNLAPDLMLLLLEHSKEDPCSRLLSCDVVGADHCPPCWCCCNMFVCWCRRAQRPLECLNSNLDTSIALLRASLADTRAAAAASKAAAAASAARGKARVSTGAVARSSSGGGSADVPKSVAGKHIMRYTCEEVSPLRPLVTSLGPWYG